MQEKKLVMSSNMSISDNRRYLPELCFPGFDGEWVVKKLGEIADSIVVGFPFKGNDLTDDNSGTLILRGMSIGDGVIKHGGEYDKYYLGDISALQKYILHKDDIVMGMDGSIGRNIALVAEKEHNSLLIQRVARIRVKNIPLHIIYQQITSQRFKIYVASEKVGAVIAHISQKQIEEFPIFVPTLPEQQMIAECLSSLDDVIAAEYDRLTALKNHKKGLMQQLFPQKGQTHPSKRFPEFNGEWEVKSLGDVFSRIRTKNSENNKNVLTISAQFGLVSQTDFFNKSVSASDVTAYYLLEKGDFAYNKSSSSGYSVGVIKPLKYYPKGVVSTLYICFRCNEPESIGFWEQYFNAGCLDKEIQTIAQEGARNHGLLNVPTEDFFQLNVMKPTLSEQKKIADCLTSLDDEIQAQQQKVDALKEHKRGLMQKLFPVIK